MNSDNCLALMKLFIYKIELGRSKNKFNCFLFFSFSIYNFVYMCVCMCLCMCYQIVGECDIFQVHCRCCRCSKGPSQPVPTHIQVDQLLGQPPTKECAVFRLDQIVLQVQQLQFWHLAECSHLCPRKLVVTQIQLFQFGQAPSPYFALESILTE
jgi:hypothetical protein